MRCVSLHECGDGRRVVCVHFIISFIYLLNETIKRRVDSIKAPASVTNQILLNDTAQQVFIVGCTPGSKSAV